MHGFGTIVVGTVLKTNRFTSLNDRGEGDIAVRASRTGSADTYLTIKLPLYVFELPNSLNAGFANVVTVRKLSDC